MSVLEAKDFKTIFNFHQSQMELIGKSIAKECAIKGCDKDGVKKWDEFGDMPVCSSHYEVMAKHIGDN